MLFKNYFRTDITYSQKLKVESTAHVSDRWLDRQNEVYTYHGILVLKKKEILTFAAMNIEGITLSQIKPVTIGTILYASTYINECLETATHSSVLARRIPGTGEPGGLPSMGSHRVGHDWSDLATAAD